MFVALCSVWTAAHAQSAASGAKLCPLSDEQTQKSIEAFDKLVPVFRDPRCIRCHGELDVFAANTPHEGGERRREEETAERIDDTCNVCHDQVAGGERWMTPSPGHAFVGKDAKTLCKQMHESRDTREAFIDHVTTDPLIKAAFIGMRAMTEEDLQELHLMREPPRAMTHEGFIAASNAWLDAMGGEFKGEPSCGCEPQRYAVRVSYKRDIKLGVVSSTETMGPVDIPIEFHDDGTFDGEQTVFFNGSSVAYICTATSTGSMNLKVSGEVSGASPNETMTVKIENTTLMKNGTVTAICPTIGVTKSTELGEKASLEKDDLPATVGTKAHFAPGAGIPGMTTSIDAEIVQVGR